MFYEAKPAWVEEEWPEEGLNDFEDHGWDQPVLPAPATPGYTPRPQPDVITLGAVLLVVLMLVGFWRDRGRAQPAAALSIRPTPSPAITPTPLPLLDIYAVAAPYDDYWITQGPHGTSYGHYAVDLAAGQGTTIKSPINGVVMNHYTDIYGNTTLIIENDLYVVTMLHGEYTAPVGEIVYLGQPVGVESNIGYTTDMRGGSCRGRSCGYHTHLNIYDKRQQQNVNPLDLIK